MTIYIKPIVTYIVNIKIASASGGMFPAARVMSSIFGITIATLTSDTTPQANHIHDDTSISALAQRLAMIEPIPTTMNQTAPSPYMITLGIIVAIVTCGPMSP